MSIQENTLALAGIIQATILVKQVARHGLVEQSAFDSSISSIFRIESQSTEEVYGGLSGLRLGLETLCDYLENNQHRDVEVVKYSLGVMVLERKFIRDVAMTKAVRDSIEIIATQNTDIAFTHMVMISQLARLYSRTMSTFDYRIQVIGEQRHLENEHNANRIRALLLAGIRSAVLWQQLGGSRWQLLFSRSKLLKAARQHLAIIHR
jgi:high frequency lysogenization protein